MSRTGTGEHCRARIMQMTEEAPDEAALQEAGRILSAGGLVAFPTETVYGLGGNALDPAAARKIYAAKGRPSDNPLIIHIASLDALEQIAEEIPDAAIRLAEAYWPGPLTMIFRKREIVPDETTGGLDSVAVRFPSNRIASLLIAYAGGFVAAPSANTSGRPSPTTAAHVIEDLGGTIDCIIDGGPVDIGLESTIVDFTVDPPVILRPGYINQEMLSAMIGTVEMDPGIQSESSVVRPKAPGMKYRHYAPKAEMTIVTGSPQNVQARIRALAHSQQMAGRSVGIICSDETRGAYPEGTVWSLGARTEEIQIAAHLYGILRDSDAAGVDVIYSEAFRTPKLGDAIMNRLMKAAGHRIIDADTHEKDDQI
ncbi:MAG: threonylcarbamoyl-AMP synthase [Eubacterium sp.]|nr:threonylcarbamoyl-AMP synthase [Eubacterium sp.]